VNAVDLLLLLPLAALGLTVCVHACLARLGRDGDLWRHLGISSLAGFLLLPAALAISLLVRGDLPGHTRVFAFDTLTFLGLAYAYAEFNNIPFTSMRLRVMGECLRRPEGVGRAELRAVYDERAAVQLRIRRYVDTGQLVRRDGRIYLRRGWVYWMVKFYEAVGAVLGIGPR
jgi:hypothetical protein